MVFVYHIFMVRDVGRFECLTVSSGVGLHAWRWDTRIDLGKEGEEDELYQYKDREKM